MEGHSNVAIKLSNEPFDMILYTGSTEKGKLIAQAAAKNLVPCVLELGGKSPVVVDESADPAHVAGRLLFGKMLNSGQTCVAPDYCYCHESKVDQLIKEISIQLEERWNNNRNDEAGKIINETHYRRLCALFEDHGGEVVVGNPNTHIDLDLQPSVILNPRLDSELMRSEIFGPVLPLLVYKDFDGVIDKIQSGDKPLAAYFMGDIKCKNFEKFKTEISAGSIATNDVMKHFSNEFLPIGGVGASGYGRYHDVYGFR